MKIVLLNINSIQALIENKTTSKFDYCINPILDKNKYDILFVLETKLNETDNDNDIKNENYQFIRSDRNGRGGGILVYYKKELNIYICIQHIIKYTDDTLFETIIFSLFNTFFICSYNPNYSNSSKYNYQLESYLSYLTPYEKKIIILGDLNQDILTNKGNKLVDLMNEYCFTSYVKDPTHKVKSGKDTLLDVVFANFQIKSAESIPTPDELCDHKIIAVSLYHV